MTTLKDYLGTLINSVGQARMMSDIEAARMARLYAADPLLKGFQIPRFRAPKVELTIPLAMDSLQQSEDETITKLGPKELEALTLGILAKQLGPNIGDKAIEKSLQKVVEIQTEVLISAIQKDGEWEENLTFFAKSVAAQSLSLIQLGETDRKSLSGDDRKSREQEIRMTLYKQLAPLLTLIGEDQLQLEARVIVESAKLKELRPEQLVYVKMTIAEEGMEWHTMEDGEGGIQSKLLPE